MWKVIHSQVKKKYSDRKITKHSALITEHAAIIIHISKNVNSHTKNDLNKSGHSISYGLSKH